MASKMNKRAQISVFVILAILLVVAIILVFIIYENQFYETVKTTKKDPVNNFKSCINNYVSEATDLIYENAGFVEQQTLTHLITNQKNYYQQFEIKEITYLCYTNLNYARCTPQAPLLISHLENEILKYIEGRIDVCFEVLGDNLIDAGYEVSFEDGKAIMVNLVENGVEVNVNKKLTQSRSGFQETFNSFDTKFRSSLYSMAKITEEIINQESLQCNSNYVKIMESNKNFKIKKFTTGEGVRIYTVEDKVTKNLWIFAIRGCKLATPG